MIKRLLNSMVDAKASTSKVLSFVQRAAIENVREMRQLDKTKFTVNVPVNYITVGAEDCRKMNTILNRLKNFIITKSRTITDFKPVQDDDDGSKIVYFDPDRVQTSEFGEAFAAVNEYFDNKLEIKEKSQEFVYEHWTTPAILECILPGEQKSSAYTQTGHIVHINTRDCNESYKDIIGQVLFDKVPGCRTVVNKGTNIEENDNVFRTFGLELIAGEPDYITTENENGIHFTFDFSKVYWNSRLSTEHIRLLQKYCKHGGVVYDMFCGVGPFALVAAKRFLCTVFANDLNPESIKWLKHNIEKNKLQSKNITVTNLDAKEFLQTVVKEDILKRVNNADDTTNDAHFIMNLPALAPTFLPYFIGLLADHKNEQQKQDQNHPFKLFVHVYMFTKNAEDPFDEAKRIVIDYFGNNRIHILDVHNVRSVSNLKEMMRVSIELPFAVLFGDPVEEEMPEKKRRKIDD